MTAYITVNSIEIEKRPFKVKAKREINILIEDIESENLGNELMIVVSELNKMIKELTLQTSKDK